MLNAQYGADAAFRENTSGFASAKAQYIAQLSSFWNDYYTLQQATLYDWQNKSDLTVNYESLIK